jgi:hypothetical protein
LPILVDETQLIGEALGADRTADIFVVNPKDWHVVYRGPMDDRLSYGTQKPVAGKNYLTDALDAALAGKPVAVAKAEALGCLVNLPERANRDAHAKISYSDRIAPLLADKCVACHRDGGVAPWAMTGYDIVRGFAPMMREVVRTKRMPPWHADPHYGSFVGDRSMTNTDAKDLVHWIEAGTPRGNGPDPLATLDKTWAEWSLGKPDLIVEVPPYDVPATGVINYQYPHAANPLGRDVWIRAIEIIPGDRSVVHHVLAGIDDPGSGERRAYPRADGGTGGLCAGQECRCLSREHGHSAAQGSELPVPGALHDRMAKRSPTSPDWVCISTTNHQNIHSRCRSFTMRRLPFRPTPKRIRRNSTRCSIATSCCTACCRTRTCAARRRDSLRTIRMGAKKSCYPYPATISTGNRSMR